MRDFIDIPPLGVVLKLKYLRVELVGARVGRIVWKRGVRGLRALLAAFFAAISLCSAVIPNFTSPLTIYRREYCAVCPASTTGHSGDKLGDRDP